MGFITIARPSIDNGGPDAVYRCDITGEGTVTDELPYELRHRYQAFTSIISEDLGFVTIEVDGTARRRHPIEEVATGLWAGIDFLSAFLWAARQWASCTGRSTAPPRLTQRANVFA